MFAEDEGLDFGTDEKKVGEYEEETEKQAKPQNKENVDGAPDNDRSINDLVLF